ncbi:MAG: hypothetical protein F9K29_07210 [Hyphomicrobiaceae bacterium]|nr:MAG: hypothetical protein F9K29_07210 [Hyphomicrobiaceae bacterium]
MMRAKKQCASRSLQLPPRHQMSGAAVNERARDLSRRTAGNRRNMRPARLQALHVALDLRLHAREVIDAAFDRPDGSVNPFLGLLHRGEEFGQGDAMAHALRMATATDSEQSRRAAYEQLATDFHRCRSKKRIAGLTASPRR